MTDTRRRDVMDWSGRVDRFRRDRVVAAPKPRSALAWVRSQPFGPAVIPAVVGAQPLRLDAFAGARLLGRSEGWMFREHLRRAVHSRNWDAYAGSPIDE